MKTHRLSGVSFGIVAGLVGIMGFAFPETALARDDEPPTITVLVNNYSQASHAALAAAEREAGRILGRAGLRALWLECPVRPSTLSPHERCENPPDATDIRLRMLDEPIQKQPQGSAFGFAVHPVLASVYYRYAMRRALSDGAEFEAPIILGCVIAHELGHLLLGSNGHSNEGIMQPRWKANQVRQLMMGRLLFTPDQSKLIRLEAQTRAERQNLASTSSIP